MNFSGVDTLDYQIYEAYDYYWKNLFSGSITRGNLVESMVPYTDEYLSSTLGGAPLGTGGTQSWNIDANQSVNTCEIEHSFCTFSCTMYRPMDNKNDELDVNFAENLVIDAIGGYRV